MHVVAVVFTELDLGTTIVYVQCAVSIVRTPPFLPACSAVIVPAALV